MPMQTVKHPRTGDVRRVDERLAALLVRQDGYEVAEESKTKAPVKGDKD